MAMSTSALRSVRGVNVRGVHASVCPRILAFQPRFVCNASKGFGTEAASEKAPEAPAALEADASSVDALEDQIRNRRPKKSGRIEPQVKVNAPVVDAVSGQTPMTVENQAETVGVLALFYFFLTILIEGLALAASGFLPESMDVWVQENIYPNFSWTVLGFLGASSIYGLYKTGKLPGQKQM